MKLFRLFLFINFLGFLIVYNSCSPTENEVEDLCKRTQWQEVKEPAIKFYATEPLGFCSTDNTHRADSASYQICLGSVQKFYCNETPSGKFDFIDTHNPTPGTSKDIPLGQLYQFKFQNDKDRLFFTCKFKVTFPDGKTYQSNDVSQNYYYKDILYNVNTFEYYIKFIVPSLTWTLIN